MQITILSVLVALSAGQQLTMPFIEANGGNLQMRASDVEFQTNVTTATLNGILASIESARQAQNNLSSTIVSLASQMGTLASQMGTLQSSISTQQSLLTSTISAMSSLNASFQSQNPALAVPCQLSNWSSWTACPPPCGGIRQRTRTVIAQATGSSVAPCSAYSLTETSPCPICTESPTAQPTMSPTFHPHPCTGMEIYYNLNSGDDIVLISSYASQTIIFGQYLSVISTRFLALGQTVSWNPSQIGSQNRTFIPGQFICAPQGVAVVGRGGDFERDWVPTRLNGSTFVVPIERDNPQKLYVQALQGGATVTLRYGSRVQGQPLSLTHYGIGSFSNINREGHTITVTSTAPIVVSIVSGTSAVGLPTDTGTSDFYALVPASQNAFGIPSQRGRIASLTGSPVVITCGNGRSSRQTPRVGFYVNAPYEVESYNGPTCRATAIGTGVLVGATSFADSDGVDATMWMPGSLMRTTFLIPMPFEHWSVSCISSGVGTYATTRNSSSTSFSIGGTAAAGHYYRGSSGNSQYVTTSVPCYLVVDGQRDGDELVIYGEN